VSAWFAHLDELHRAIVCALVYFLFMSPTLFLPEFVNYSHRKIDERRVTYDERDD
jgi:hypothetical protein